MKITNPGFDAAINAVQAGQADGIIAGMSVTDARKATFDFSDSYQGKNVILLVPHGWAIDVSGIILHTHGIPMTSMYNPHRNPLVDWLWTLARERFGGKMHARQNGIKPFLAHIRQGQMGYYLPDEDFGEEQSNGGYEFF